MNIPKNKNPIKLLKSFYSIQFLLLFFSGDAQAQPSVSLTLNLDKPGVDVSPKLYGLMTEEIDYSYDGGLYAELIRNRIFKDNLKIRITGH